HTVSQVGQVRERGTAYIPQWRYVPATQLGRAESDVLVEEEVRKALIRLNPEINARPALADEVIYRLRAILLSVRSDGLVRANEEFTAWLRGERSMPFGSNNEHTSVALIDFKHPKNNTYIMTTQLTYRNPEKRFDVVLLVNGIPLVVGETKTPTRPAITWVDGADDIHNDYEVNVPAFFVPNVFSFATEGKTYRFGSIRMPLELWAPWRDVGEEQEAAKAGKASEAGGMSGLAELQTATQSMLRPEVILDILQHFTLFATDKQHRKIKIICRYQQYQAVNQIVERVVAGRIKKGLIWHFQGSGKSLLMVFAAQKLRQHPALKNPTVLIVVDRIDLDTQITATFNAADVPNMLAVDKRETLQTLLAQDTRKVLITTIHKFSEAPGVLNMRSNIILMVDEAHRTQEGDLGDKMRRALPNAFLFGLTGTPINKRDRNTFWAFGAVEDEQGYMSRYSFEESIRDNATLPLHFEPRLVKLHVDKDAIDEAFANLTGHLSEDDQANLARMSARMAALVKSSERVRAVVADIVQHFREHVEPNGFKAQIVTFDRQSCLQYKQELDKLLPKEASEIVMTVNASEKEYREYDRKKEEEEKLLDRFRNPRDPLKFLIVTSKLLTGFDAPILQAMYLDKPMKEHSLLQAVCRTNRPYPNKSYGLIVDYLGVFDDVAAALDFDEQSMRRVITGLEGLRAQLPGAVESCLQYFPAVDRAIVGYEGLLAAQECLPDNDRRDAYAEDYSVLARLWEALSPDACLQPHMEDYRWLTQVYESVKPPGGHGKLLWHALGAKTTELINANIHVITTRDDLDKLVMDAGALADILGLQEPKQVKEFELKIIARLRKHQDRPKFIELGRRLEALKERHELGLITNLTFINQLLELARDVVQAEKEVEPVEERDEGKAALTELFNEARNGNTPVMVERIVNDIDEIVRIVRFPGWQETVAGDREVKQALRKTLFKYKLHQEQALFERAYEYIKQYY
ncbi:MAG TPA: HsdR family type I site-specific deoxyribonuclease, partial [Ktedonobacteraceae bacterium]|nr:HsdR family type I site-specific deoxyribonuclease [Ktedonobacteraceae bacterium]